MVECLTWDQGVAGLSLTVITALCLWARDIKSLLSIGSIQEDPSWHNWKIVDWDVKNQIKHIEILTCDPLKYKLDNSILIVSICRKYSIRMKRVNVWFFPPASLLYLLNNVYPTLVNMSHYHSYQWFCSLTLCMLGIFSWFFCRLLTSFKKFFQEHYQNVKRFESSLMSKLGSKLFAKVISRWQKSLLARKELTTDC